MIIETARLRLREFVLDDWRAVQIFQSDPRYLRYYEWTERTEQDVRDFVRMFVDYQAAEPRRNFQMAVTLKLSGALIGSCGVRVNHPEWREANIGYEIAPDHWGNGYASEAARAILQFGFRDLGMHRIWAWCVADNGASARVLEKVGMTREGREREKEWIKGHWHDRLIYAVLDYEWRSQQQTAGGGR